MKLDLSEIVRAIRRSKSGTLSGREVAAALQLSSGARRGLSRQLRELERQGLLKRTAGGRYSLARTADVREAIVSLNRQGDGWVMIDHNESARIPGRFLGGARDGDRVRFSLLRRDRSNRLSAKVLEIIERSGKPVVGIFQRGRNDNMVLPVDPALRQTIMVGREELPGLKPGDWVVVRPFATPTANDYPSGELVEVLGDPTDPAIESKAVAARFSIPLHFSPAVLAEAEVIGCEVPQADLVDRDDLRHLPFITIDGETARDFDDAVTVSTEGEFYRLWVAIADVSHYVTTGSALDLSALERGTSVYFPGFCIPMLPEALSNEICSLKPGVDRLVLVAEMKLDRRGQPVSSSFYPGVIKSRARMTYNEIQCLLDQPPADEVSAAGGHLNQLPQMLELSHCLTRQRQERGSLDFDIPEPVVVLDQTGHPTEIVSSVRLAAHRIVEEFMLAANEAVAAYLNNQKRDLLYRIHEPPDPTGFAVLNHYLATHSLPALTFKQDLHPDLQRLVRMIEEPAEKKVISRLLLQSMKQARYCVVNAGHYGLAAERYCHFTSPIRRYPDLIVHRILKQCLLGQPSGMDQAQLSDIAEMSSRRERIAIDAERDVLAMLSCRFMEDKVGGQYAGVISSVQKFGLFVELSDQPIEGLVHISKLDDDYYQYDQETGRLVGERGGKIYSIGMSVKIVLENVNIARREIDFTLLPAPGTAQRGPTLKGRRKPKSWR